MYGIMYGIWLEIVIHEALYSFEWKLTYVVQALVHIWKWNGCIWNEYEYGPRMV